MRASRLSTHELLPPAEVLREGVNEASGSRSNLMNDCPCG
jgi:hypothetical protein